MSQPDWRTVGEDEDTTRLGAGGLARLVFDRPRVLRNVAAPIEGGAGGTPWR